MQADWPEEDGTKDQVVFRVKIVPGLAISVECAAAIHIDIGASELEKGRGVLEDLRDCQQTSSI
jgi:hypothetical protein